MSNGSSKFGTNGGSAFKMLSKSMELKYFITLHSSAPGRSDGVIVSRASTVSMASSDNASSSTGHSMSAKNQILLNISLEMFFDSYFDSKCFQKPFAVFRR